MSYRHAGYTSCELRLILTSTEEISMNAGHLNAMHRTAQPFHRISGDLTTISDLLTATRKASGQVTITPCMMTLYLVLDTTRQSQATTWV